MKGYDASRSPFSVLGRLYFIGIYQKAVMPCPVEGP
jgi:hypothetical protein